MATKTKRMTKKRAAIYRDLARARRIYADDGIDELVDTGSGGRTLTVADCSEQTCCPSLRNYSPELLDYQLLEK